MILIQYISRKLVNFLKRCLIYLMRPIRILESGHITLLVLFGRLGTSPQHPPIPKGPIFANPEGSQFCQSGGVPMLPIRKDPIFANPEGSKFCQSGRVPFLPIRKGPIFANPERSYFRQSGGVLFLQTRGFYYRQNLTRQKKSKRKGIKLLGVRLGTSDCIGNLSFITDQTKTKQV